MLERRRNNPGAAMKINDRQALVVEARRFDLY